MARRLNRGDVHLYPFSAPDKLRPVVVLTRDSSVGNLSTVTVAPIISTIRAVASAVALSIDDGMKGPCAVSLHNLQTVSQDRLGKWVTRLSAQRMREVCAALRFSLGCG